MSLLGKRRGRIEIIGTLLKQIEAAKKSNGKTRHSDLVFEMRLSWSRLGPTVEAMEKAGLIVKEGREFKITQLGENLLTKYETLKATVDDLEKQLEEVIPSE